MIVINPSSSALNFVLQAAHTSAAGSMHVAWRDITPATPAYIPESIVIASNGTTAVNLITAPASGTYSLVDYISYLNNDTGSQQISVRVGSVVVQKVILGVGERLEYVEGKGWTTYMNNGAVKVTYSNGTSPISSSISMNVLNADVTNNNGTANTIADVTGLSFAVTNGQRYRFTFFIRYTAAATTTGSRWSIQGPTTTELTYNSDYTLTVTSGTTNRGLTAYDLPAASNATSATTAAGNIAIIEGIIRPSADGTVIARFASEIASSAIVAKAGSYVLFQAL